MTNKLSCVVDGANFSNSEEFAAEITRVLFPEDGWNGNLDAFNDMLRGYFGTPEGGFVLVWRNPDPSRDRLGYAETVRWFERKLERSDLHESNIPSFREMLDEAKQGRGTTVFDWLAKIIRTHGEGGEESEDGVELVLIPGD